MIRRDSYLNRLIHNMWNGEVKVITGIRRCYPDPCIPLVL